MRAQTDNAGKIAAFLAGHPAVSRVHYPGLTHHPGHPVARKQMDGFGAMLSFELQLGETAARRTASQTQLFRQATSLGSVESLIEHRASVEGPYSQTPPSLLRVSVGLEHPDDLIEDLEQAIQASGSPD
jgi:cystathionine gamma-synthase